MKKYNFVFYLKVTFVLFPYSVCTIHLPISPEIHINEQLATQNGIFKKGHYSTLRNDFIVIKPEHISPRP